MPILAGNTVECEASTFPLVNSTKVSTAVHSICYFNFIIASWTEGDILAPFFL